MSPARRPRSVGGTRTDRHVLAFRAMGTCGHLDVTGPDARGLARSGLALITSLEQRWSRFLPSSDVSRMNAAGGRPVAVDPMTVALLDLAVAGWRGTDGRFSPFLQPAMLDIGYRRSRSSARVLTPSAQTAPILTSSARTASPRDVASRHSPLRIDRAACTVMLERGAGIDLGGIAKGFSADLVLAELMDRGASSALVDLGGDMAFSVEGDGPGADASDDGGKDRAALIPWSIAVDDPFDAGSPIDMLTALRGGVATSSTLRRRWLGADGEDVHHIVDPDTGRSCATDVAAVTVVADTCANAEVLSKQLLLAGVGAAVGIARDGGFDAIVVGRDRVVRRVGQWEGTRT